MEIIDFDIYNRMASMQMLRMLYSVTLIYFFEVKYLICNLGNYDSQHKMHDTAFKNFDICIERCHSLGKVYSLILAYFFMVNIPIANISETVRTISKSFIHI